MLGGTIVSFLCHGCWSPSDKSLFTEKSLFIKQRRWTGKREDCSSERPCGLECPASLWHSGCFHFWSMSILTIRSTLFEVTWEPHVLWVQKILCQSISALELIAFNLCTALVPGTHHPDKTCYASCHFLHCKAFWELGYCGYSFLV